MKNLSFQKWTLDTYHGLSPLEKLPPGQLWQRLVASQAARLHGTAMAARLFEAWKENIGISVDEPK